MSGQTWPPVTFVVCNNSSYRLLKQNLVRYWQDTGMPSAGGEFPPCFDVHEQVELEKICFGPSLHWFRIGNVWHNASLRSIIYTVAAQGRKIGGLIQRRS